MLFSLACDSTGREDGVAALGLTVTVERPVVRGGLFGGEESFADVYGDWESGALVESERIRDEERRIRSGCR